MNFASQIFGEIYTESIGWFLIHSVWQGGIIAILLLVVLALLKNRSAQLRYYISFASLILVILTSSYSFHNAFLYANDKAQLKKAIIQNPSYLSDQFKSNHNAGTENSALTSKNIRLNKIKLRARIQTYFPWIVTIWIIGLLFYLIRISGSWLYLYQLRSLKRIALEQAWIKKTIQFCARLKIRRPVSISLSPKIKNPITLGFFKPLILIPASLMGGLTPEMLEAIIVHELAHIRRNDFIMNILQTLIETLFFFHPGVWYISSQIRRERELACDDIVLGVTSDRITYAKALTIAQENSFLPEKIAVAFASGKKSLLQRITRLNTKITMKTNLFEKLAAGLVILSAFLFLSFIIDGNNTEIREKNSTNNDFVDSLAKPNPDIIIVHKTGGDSSNTRKIIRREQIADIQEIDSLITTLHSIDCPDDEVEKVIELVLCEPDLIDYEEIMRNIHIALDEIDMAEIEKKIREAEKEMAECTAQLEYEYLTKLEHLKDCDSMNEVVMITVKDAMEIARKELENLNIDSIVNQAMEEANRSLEDIDIEFIIADAMKEAHTALEEEQVKVIKIKKELEEKEIDLAEQEIRLKEREAELKEQLRELEEQLKEIKQKRKEESNK